MGEAKRRGTFEQRKAAAVAAGRAKSEFRREVLWRDFLIFPPDVGSYPKPQRRALVNGGHIYRSVRALPLGHLIRHRREHVEVG